MTPHYLGCKFKGPLLVIYEVFALLGTILDHKMCEASVQQRIF
jgi:hypothetical protein